MTALHNLYFHYVLPGIEKNGSTVALGALLLPLVKKYLGSKTKWFQTRLGAWVSTVLRLRVTVKPADQAKPSA